MNPPQSTDAAGFQPTPIRGVALDMDGLLFDTESLYWQVGETVLGRRGRRFCRDLQQRMMGRVGVAALQQMVDFHGLEDGPVELLEESNAIYSELLAGGPPPMPGLEWLIQTLEESALPFGVATSSQRKFAERILSPQPWFASLAFLLTGDDVTHGKPHPEIYSRAADRLAISPAQMLVLEDSGNGTAAAIAAGAIVVSVPNENTRDHCFDGAIAVVQCLDDPVLRRILGGSAGRLPLE